MGNKCPKHLMEKGEKTLMIHLKSIQEKYLEINHKLDNQDNQTKR